MAKFNTAVFLLGFLLISFVLIEAVPLPQSKKTSIVKKRVESIKRVSVEPTTTTMKPPTTRPAKTSTIKNKTRGTRPPKNQ
ncbi:unnamed protein product [Diamesa serratosioi]